MAFNKGLRHSPKPASTSRDHRRPECCSNVGKPAGATSNLIPTAHYPYSGSEQSSDVGQKPYVTTRAGLPAFQIARIPE